MLLNENCLDTMKRLPDNSIDAIITDPPYGIKLFNKKWDYDIPSIEIWKEALRTLKPGAHMLVACGTRTQHKMASAIEDAGFEIRDIIVYAYGSGMPKGRNIYNDVRAEIEKQIMNKTGEKEVIWE
jgi:site-specific DNA-methyltransferase (adenine-specific)